MALDRDNAMLDLTGTYLNQVFREQSWFKRNSNTVTAVVGFLVTVVGYLASTPILDNGWGNAVVVLVGFLATVVGVKFTPNGLSKSQMAKVSRASGDFVGETPLVVEESSVDLDALVEDYNSGSSVGV